MTPTRSRRAFTLVETLIALSLATIAAAAIFAALARQQRIARGIDTMIAVRDPLRDATDLLTAALRGASRTDTLQFASDTAIELDVTIGASTLCTASSGVTFSLPPDTTASGAPLTTWVTTPDTGDAALVFHDSTTASPIRRWERIPIQKVAIHQVAFACPAPSPFVTPADTAAHAMGYTVTLAAAPSPAVPMGTPIRFVRHARYSIYRASDHQWYLGYRRCAPSCEVVQPVTGPYQSGSTPPVTFTYDDSNGNPLSAAGPLTGVARVKIAAHAASVASLSLPGRPTASFTDSAETSVSFRNRQ